MADKNKQKMPPINGALQGLLLSEKALEKTADRVARSGVSPAGASDSVSLSDEAVSLLAVKTAYETNLRTLMTSDEMTKKLLDMLG